MPFQELHVVWQEGEAYWKCWYGESVTFHFLIYVTRPADDIWEWTIFDHHPLGSWRRTGETDTFEEARSAAKQWIDLNADDFRCEECGECICDYHLRDYCVTRDCQECCPSYDWEEDEDPDDPEPESPQRPPPPPPAIQQRLEF